MKTANILKNKSINDLATVFSRQQREELQAIFKAQAEQEAKLESHRLTFLTNVKEWGYANETAFLVAIGAIGSPNERRTRTVTDPAKRAKVSENIKANPQRKPQEVADEFEVTVDVVYAIRGELNLTKKKAPTTEPNTAVAA